MSDSSGNPRLPAADANKRNVSDVEQGDLQTEKQRFSPNPQESSSNDENLDAEPDEYARLLKYIDLEAKKEKGRCGDDGAEGEDQEMRRLWYMPWKKVPVQSTKARKVPPSWLETDMSQGLSDAEIDGRRARLGCNELERCVDQSLILQKILSSLHAVRGSIP
jgi:H+-transporting ATPase